MWQVQGFQSLRRLDTACSSRAGLTALSVLTTACADSRPRRPSDSQKASSVIGARGLRSLPRSARKRRDLAKARLGPPEPGWLEPRRLGLSGRLQPEGPSSEVLVHRSRRPSFSEPRAYDHRNLIHDDLGGIRRFWLLAGQYHRDFPTQPTFAYWAPATTVSRRRSRIGVCSGASRRLGRRIFVRRLRAMTRHLH